MDKIGKFFSEVFLYRGTNLLSGIGGGLIVILMLITVVTVISRKLIPAVASVMTGGYEVAMLIMSMICVLSVAYAWYTGGHVRIGVLRDKWSPRRKAILDTISTFLGMIIVALFAFGVWRRASYALEMGQATDLQKVPMGPFILFWSLIMAFFFLVLTRSLVGLFAKALGKKFGHEPYLQGQ